MQIREAVAGVCLVTLLVLPGCGSGESDSGPVPASIAGGAEQEKKEGGAGGQGRTAAKPQLDPLRPVVEIETTLGKITLELDAEHAPGTVRNFLNYVHAGHYNQTIFHFVSPESIVLGGGYTADFDERPTLSPIRNEAHNGLKNARGALAMSRLFDFIDSATAQFFINVADNSHLDFQDDEAAETYGYCVFGKVTGGMDVVDRIARVAVRESGDFAGAPQEPVVIQAARQVR